MKKIESAATRSKSLSSKKTPAKIGLKRVTGAAEIALGKNEPDEI